MVFLLFLKNVVIISFGINLFRSTQLQAEYSIDLGDGHYGGYRLLMF